MRPAGRLIAELRGDSAPRDLDGKQAVALHQLLHEAKFRDPCGDHLSPAGGPLPAALPVIYGPHRVDMVSIAGPHSVTHP